MPMDTMATALWDLFENQRVKGLVGAMRQTLSKLEKAGQADAQWSNAMGEMALLDKDFMGAANFFRQAINEKSLPKYELNLGNALFYSGEFQGAKKILLLYHENHPDDVNGLVNLANCHLQLKELSKVKDLCSLALEGKITKAPLWNCLGQVAFLEGDIKRAWEYFNQAYVESPEYIDALFNRANMAYRLAKSEEALADYAMCLRKDENYTAALLNSAVLRFEKGEWEAGKECANRALKLDPDSLEGLHILGRLQMGGKDYRSARDAFQKILLRHPEHTRTLLALAKLHFQEAEQSLALSLILRVLSQKVLPPEERGAALTLLLDLGEHLSCIQHINKLPEAHISPELRKILIVSLWKTDQIKVAIQHLEGLLKKEGETAGTLTLLGRMLAESGGDALAEARYRKALKLDPGARGAASELARMHLSRGEGQKAVALLEGLLSQYPEDPDCYYNLACCHAKNRNFDDSLHNLKMALENGFQDLDKISADDDLSYIRQFEEYTQLAGQSGLN